MVGAQRTAVHFEWCFPAQAARAGSVRLMSWHPSQRPDVHDQTRAAPDPAAGRRRGGPAMKRVSFATMEEATEEDYQLIVEDIAEEKSHLPERLMDAVRNLGAYQGPLQV